MRLWIKVLIGALALVLVLVAGAALFISQVDPNEYRGVISDAVERTTGRELSVGGDLHIKLLPVPSVEVNDVTFANAPWASQPDMVRAKRVRAELALLPLLKGRVVVHRLVAIEPQVFLETDADGRGNWQFGDAGASSAETGVETGAPSGERDIVVSEVRIEKAGLAYLDGKTKSKTSLGVDTLTIGTEWPGGSVALSVQATYQGLPVTLDGSLGTAGAILHNQPIEVDLEGTLNDAGFTVQGTVGKPLDGRDLRLDVGLKSKSSKKITDIVGAELEEIGPVDLEFRLLEAGDHFHLDPVRVSARPRGTDVRVSGSVKNIALALLSGSAGAKAKSKPVNIDLVGNVGESRLQVVGDVGNPIEAKGLRLDVALDIKSTRPLTDLAGMEFEEIGPLNVMLTLLEQGGHYEIDDIKVTARPRNIDASMSGSVKNLVLGLDEADAQSKPAKVKLEGTLGEARFAVTGDVGKPMEGKDLRLKVVLETKSTRPLTERAGIEFEEIGPVNLTLTLLEQGGRYDIDAIKMTAQPRDADASLRGSIKNLLLGLDEASAQSTPAKVKLEGALGEARFAVTGDVGRPMEGKDLRLKVALETSSTRPLTDLAGIEFEEIGPLNLTLTLLEQGGRYEIDAIKMTARPRQTDASLRGSVKNLVLALDGAKARAEPAKVNVGGTLGEARFTVTGDVGKPMEGKDLRLNVGLETSSTRVLTDLAGIEFEEIGPLNLTLTLLEQGGQYDIDAIKMTARPRNTDVSMGGSVTNLVLDLDGAKAQGKPAKVNVKGALGEARFTVTGDVGKPMQGKDVRLNVALESKSTRPLTELAGVDVKEVGPLNLELTVIEKDGRFDLDSIDMTVRPRDANVTIKGSVLDVIDNPRPDMDVSVSAKTLRQLDGTLPDVGPVSVSATIRPRGKVVEIRDLVAKVGNSDLSGSATVDTRGERPSASAKLRAGVIDLAELVLPADKSDTGAVEEKPSDGKIFPDDPLPVAALRKANGDIELAVDRLITAKLTLHNVDVAARLDNGNLTVKPTAHIAGGTVGATITIDARAQPAKFSADVDAKKVSIGALTKEIRGFETSKGLDSNLKMKLRGQGESVRGLMGGLGGDIRLEIGDGRLNNDVLDRVGADLLTQIIGVAVPTDEEDKTTGVNCGVVRFAIKEGDVIADQTLVMETDKVLLKGGGIIDLKTEDLDLGAKLAARKGIRIGAGTLSNLIRVQGTLAKPRFGTDLEGVVKTGARVGVAVATFGLSLLAESVYVSVSKDAHPCQTALARQIAVTPTEYKAQSTSGDN